MSLTVEQVQSSWFAELLSRALRETTDPDEAAACAEMAYLAHPEPVAASMNGMPHPVPIVAKLSFDIENRHAQGVLNRATAAAQKMTKGLRTELEAALRQGNPSQAGASVVKFIGKYRDQLASLLGRTQLASLLAGAREVAASVPVLPRMTGFGAPPPPSLPPGEAQDLLEQLRGQSLMQREEALLTRPASEQIWLRRAVAHAEATPPPSTLEMKDVEFPVVEEAVRDLSRKNILTKERADALEAASKQKAFTVAGVESTETLTRIRQAIAENIKEGVSYDSFRKKVLSDVDAGTMLSDAHLETLFRGAVSAAFSDGQMNVLQEPFVRGGFPYAAYDSISDDRRRHTHGELEHLGIQGTNIYRINDPVFQTFRPPWEYGDRCSWKAMTVKQAANDGIEEAKQWLESGEEPNPPAFVAMPPFQPPPDFQRIPMSIQLAMGPIGDYMGGFQEKCSSIPHLRGWRVKGGRGRRRGQHFFTNRTHGSFAYVPTKQIGEKWQGLSGRWFIKLQSGRVAPAKAPGAGEAGNPQSGPPKPPPPQPAPGQKPVPQPRTRKPTPKQAAKVQSVDAVHAARQKLQAGQALTAEEIAGLPEHLARMTVPELKALHNEVVGSKLTSRTLKQGSIDALMKWANPNAKIASEEPAEAPQQKPEQPVAPPPEKPAEVPAPTPDAPAVPTEAAKPDTGSKIVDLFHQLDKEAGRHNFVDIVKFRKGMEEAGIKGREAQDAAMMELRKAGVLTLSGIEGRHGITPEQQRDAIREDGSKLGYASLKEGWQEKLAALAGPKSSPEASKSTPSSDKPAEPAKPPESPGLTTPGKKILVKGLGFPARDTPGTFVGFSKSGMAEIEFPADEVTPYAHKVQVDPSTLAELPPPFEPKVTQGGSEGVAPEIRSRLEAVKQKLSNPEGVEEGYLRKLYAEGPQAAEQWLAKREQTTGQPESPVTPPAPEAAQPPAKPEIVTPEAAPKPRMSNAERNKVITDNMGLAHTIANEIGKQYKVDPSDLAQEIALLWAKVLPEFDPSRGLTLPQFLAAKARNKMTSHSRTAARRQIKTGARGDFGAEEGGALETAQGREQDPAALAEAKESEQQALAKVNRLHPDTANAIKDYFGLEGREKKTQEQIGAELGLTKAAVSARINKAMKQIGMESPSATPTTQKETEQPKSSQGFNYDPGLHTDAKAHLEGVVNALEQSKDLTPEQKTEYGNAYQSTLKAMNQAALKRFTQNNHSQPVFAKDTAALTDYLRSKYPKAMQNHTGGKKANGGFVIENGKGQLILDGSRGEKKQERGRAHTADEIYRHEAWHAIDGTNKVVSSSPEWKEAWQAELTNGSLTEYAGKLASEGLAEFGRAVYSPERFPPEELKASFPKCWAALQKFGLI